MILRFVLLIWGVVYPVFVLLAAPFWLLKMIRRNGWGSGLLERLGWYDCDAEFEKSGGVYIHAVSVGEVLLALKLIAKWKEEAEDHFILVPTTATGMAVAKENAPEGVRVIYAPLDFGVLIRRVMRRFSPRLVVTVESEFWPNLIAQTHHLGIPIGLMNARLSRRSGDRLRRFRVFVKVFLERLDYVGVPEKVDLSRWEDIGVRAEALTLTGNVKFDPDGAALPSRRSEFSQMLAEFPEAPVAMAVSTFPGEEEYLASAFREAGFLPVIVPRHAERREEVLKVLGGGGVLRSRFEKMEDSDVLVVDSTGELQDWTAHADVVVIGKSFRAKGGQNPSEAILAGVPVICGPYMGNFEPLVSELKEAGGIQMVGQREELLKALRKPLNGQVENAKRVLEKHRGAMRRTIALFTDGA